MAKNRDIEAVLERVDLLERKVGILEAKVEESKRFAFEELRGVLLRLNDLEDAAAKAGSKVRGPR